MSSVAKLGDPIYAGDTHFCLTPSPGGPIVTPIPSMFNGRLVENLAKTVCVDNMPVALDGSVALNEIPHIPVAGPFQKPPSNRGTVKVGSRTVKVEGKPIACGGDQAETCNDPVDDRRGVVVASSTVKVGR